MERYPLVLGFEELIFVKMTILPKAKKKKDEPKFRLVASKDTVLSFLDDR